MSWVGVGIILANLGLKQVYKEKCWLDHSDCHMSQSRVSPKKWVEHNPATVCCSVAASYRWRTRAAAVPTQSARHVPQFVGTDAGGRTPAPPTASERETVAGRPLLVGDQLLQDASRRGRSRSKVGGLCRAAARRAGSPRTSGPTDVSHLAGVRRRSRPAAATAGPATVCVRQSNVAWMAPIYRVGVKARPLCVACGSAVGGPPPPAADCEKSWHDGHRKLALRQRPAKPNILQSKSRLRVGSLRTR